MLRALIAAMLLLSACAQSQRGPAPAPSPPGDTTTPIVYPTGLAQVPIGAARADVQRHVNHDIAGCNAQLASHPQGSLVFTAEDRLVLVWFEHPLRTPDDISTGVLVERVKQTYPGAQALTAPVGSHRFDGLLVTAGEHGYLFLHDGRIVQKAIAGYVEYLRRLFDTGFGVC